MNKFILDDYEKQIENQIDEYIPLSEKEKNKILRAATKNITVSLRINENLLKTIKIRAAEEGIPYQTLISSILHKYVTNRLIEEKYLKQAVKTLKL